MPTPTSPRSPLVQDDNYASLTPPAKIALFHTVNGTRINLPKPTYHPPDPSKKSHARKQPLGHISRPRNAFILFRCDCVRQGIIPSRLEKNHRDISCMVGGLWRQMSESDKAPWLKMAEKEKMMHLRDNPGYRYAPLEKFPLRRRKRGDEEDPESPTEEAFGERRSSSCPVAESQRSQRSLEDKDTQAPGLAPTQALMDPRPTSPRSDSYSRRPSSCPPPECPPHLVVPSQGRPDFDHLLEQEQPIFEREAYARGPYALQTGAYALHIPGEEQIPDRWKLTSWDAAGTNYIPPELQFFGLGLDDLPPMGRLEDYTDLVNSRDPPQFTNPFASDTSELHSSFTAEPHMSQGSDGASSASENHSYALPTMNADQREHGSLYPQITAMSLGAPLDRSFNVPNRI